MATVQIKLPRYVRPKPLADGDIAYFWELPTWAHPPRQRHGIECPIKSQPLGKDMGEAERKAEILNDVLDGWRAGAGPKLVPGTVTWLFAWYRDQDRYKRCGAKTRTDYSNLMQRIQNEPMKVGILGQRRAGAVNAAAADKIYSRWRKKHGERQASYAMQVCRLVWNWAVRHHDVTGVEFNPFSKMALSSAVGEGNRATTRAEYDLYRATARKMGWQYMATAAALSFELCQRVWDVFGFVDPDGKKARGFVWQDYVEGVSITFRQSKTGKPMVLDLVDIVDGQTVRLFPDLEDELARTRRTALQIVVDSKTGLPLTYDVMNDRHRAICEKAGLPKKMTFTGFRHGGITELGDAGIDDVRPISGHTQLQTTAIYNKASATKARAAQIARLGYLEGKKEA